MSMLSPPPPPPPPPLPPTPSRERAKSKGEGKDDSHLPRGLCRFILLHPEVKGLRCACVGFALNRSVPGSLCECGHQACYHVPDNEGSIVRQGELEALYKRINQLEMELRRDRGLERLVQRLSRLEELVDSNRAETEAEMKNLHRGVGGLWHNVGILNKRIPSFEDRIDTVADDVQRARNRLEELDDAAMQMEDRVEGLENVSIDQTFSFTSRRRRASTPPSDPVQDLHVLSEEAVPELSTSAGSAATEELQHIHSYRESVASRGSGSQAWTVHVSFLPALWQPFPFEKDTAAYKRCLSRGLHKVIAIPGRDGHSFTAAVERNFAEIIRGRPWQPLAAKICDAKILRGLPMLRPFQGVLTGADYTYDFLQQHCAVTDDVGKILDVYVAMTEGSLSWEDLKSVTPFMDGLEASWDFDSYLDDPSVEMDDPFRKRWMSDHKDDPTVTATATSPLTPTRSTKRKESGSPIIASFGGPDNESKRQKLHLPTSASVEIVKRRAETA